MPPSWYGVGAHQISPSRPVKSWLAWFCGEYCGVGNQMTGLLPGTPSLIKGTLEGNVRIIWRGICCKSIGWHIITWLKFNWGISLLYNSSIENVGVVDGWRGCEAGLGGPGQGLGSIREVVTVTMSVAAHLNDYKVLMIYSTNIYTTILNITGGGKLPLFWCQP